MNPPKATINITAWICQEDIIQKAFLPVSQSLGMSMFRVKYLEAHFIVRCFLDMLFILLTICQT